MVCLHSGVHMKGSHFKAEYYEIQYNILLSMGISDIKRNDISRFCSSHDSKRMIRVIIEDLDEELEMKSNGDE
uniref:Uncharacterized protein n=1 Tax=Vespula pensylvanica TaxID=30213 RepID=A0A834PEG2_VESPE|nr:hypothetical protein H0235_000553 [Vespula pensylvanica]